MKDEKTSRAAGAKAPAKRAPKAVAKAVGAPVKTAAVKTAATAPDPRSVPAPTAPASVARKAAEAIAPVASVAAAAPKAVAKAALAPASRAEAPMAAFAPVTLEGVAPLAAAFQAGADQARAAYDRARENGDTFRQAVTDTTAATTRGFLEFNGKVIDLVRAQNEAALDLWRSTLTAGSFSEAIRAQTHGMREAYETSAAQWKDLAETAGRLMGEATQPLRSAFQGR